MATKTPTPKAPDGPTAVAPALPPSVPAQAPPAIHNVEHEARLLRSALQDNKVPLGFFLGAGCPSGIYDAEGKNSLKWIPDVAGLTKKVRECLGESDKGTADGDALAPLWDGLVAACKEGDVDSPNVEDVLSELRTLCARKGKSAVDKMPKDRLTALDTKVCDLIVDEVGKRLPVHRCAYNRFASWLNGLQSLAPVEVFTPNYDLLIEEALEGQRIPHFDGFVGSFQPFFDLASMEQDAVPDRWTRLWKLHGSINWQKEKDRPVFRASEKAAKGTAMIYPSHLKYEESRRMPYLAMLDRLRAFFHSGRYGEGFGPPVLITCGYSFSDKHLNEVLLDGLSGNSRAHCFALAFSELAKCRPAVEHASKQRNLTVLARDGAVVRGREGLYLPFSSAVGDQETWLYTEDAGVVVGGDSNKYVRSHLGDFHYFNLFLEQLGGGVPNEPQPEKQT